MVAEKTIVTNLKNLDTIGMGERKPYLIFIAGPSVGQVYILEEGETSVGRGQGVEVLVEDESISRRHILFSVDGQHVELRDLGSTNGTFVNGTRISQCMLEDGDRIQISSNTIMKFSFQDKLENIFHKELFRMAVSDPLTAIYNKRFFLDRLEEEFSHAKRGQQNLSLILFDVDHFKTFNDSYGHLAGDFVLQRIAEIVQQMTRTGDVFARYGGEEFIVSLRQAPLEGALVIAERIRSRIAAIPFEYDGKTFQVTVSVGVTTYNKGVTNPRGLIQDADRYLYMAKEKGRNCVCSATPLAPNPPPAA